MNRRICLIPASALVLSLLATSGTLEAHVERKGEWPTTEKGVTLSLERVSRPSALRGLAEAAGWSVVVEIPPGDPIDVFVRNEPPARVLDILLSDGTYEAKREGNLVVIKNKGETTPSPARSVAPETSSSGTVSSDPGEDRSIAGGRLVIEKGEVARNVSVAGGSLRIYGTVTGDISVAGGSVRIEPGAHVRGNISAFGGSVRIEDGARVDGKVRTVGGSVRGRGLGDSADKAGKKARNESPGAPGIRLADMASSVGAAITRSAMLFVFGAVILSLLTQRFESLRAEVATRPMRTFALGIVGSLAATAIVVGLCVIVIGIPVAIVGALLAPLAVFSGISATLSVVGEGLIRHKTQNPHLHLALGCLLFLVVSNIPYVGGIVTFIVAMLGVGACVATRGGGILARRNAPVGAGPYRTVEDGSIR